MLLQYCQVIIHDVFFAVYNAYAASLYPIQCLPESCSKAHEVEGPSLILDSIILSNEEWVGGREGGSIGGGAPLGQELPQVDTEETVDV